MIPVRRRAPLPAGHWWIAHHDHGHLIVTVSALVPPGSDLEQDLVREAVRAWQHNKRKGLVLLPAPITGGAGLGWLVRQIRKPAVATGTAVATVGVALAVTLTELPHQAPYRPPVAAAPPVMPEVPGPGHDTTPRRPVAAPQHPGPVSPQPSQAHAVAAVSTSRVHVDPARLPARLPVRVPPVHWTPPKVPGPPVKVPPPPPVKVTDCRLVELHVGKLVRVCL